MAIGEGIATAIGEALKAFNNFLDPEKRAGRKSQQLEEQERKITDEINEIIVNKNDIAKSKRLVYLLRLRKSVHKQLGIYT